MTSPEISDRPAVVVFRMGLRKGWKEADEIVENGLRVRETNFKRGKNENYREIRRSDIVEKRIDGKAYQKSNP